MHGQKTAYVKSISIKVSENAKVLEVMSFSNIYIVPLSNDTKHQSMAPGTHE